VASGIPDLKLDFLLVYFHISNLKINANSGHKVIGEGVILTKKVKPLIIEFNLKPFLSQSDFKYTY